MTGVYDLTAEDTPALTALYEEYGWWDDREVDAVREALAETEVAVGVEDDGELVAAARVLTDFTGGTRRMPRGLTPWRKPTLDETHHARWQADSPPYM
ncbi:hypothetical protein [Halomicrococcus sp. NG-SE-24]|uniref:hypothetical protein n=1 Tax=Halomicrococcus sp. NG-SE-24 TaxID=3436928 RepID=UPI003D9891F2